MIYVFVSFDFHRVNLERKKITGELPPFDPSAHYIHPMSRVGLSIRISRTRIAVNPLSGRSMKSTPEIEIVPDSQGEEGTGGEEDEMESDEDDGEYDEDVSFLHRRRRSSIKPKKALPFSLKKTRSRRIFVPDSDQEHEGNDDSTGRLPTRRSTRTRHGIKVNLDPEVDSYELDRSEEDSDYYGPRSARVKRSKPKNKLSRPAYGHFRSVEDLKFDENTPLHQHRNTCERCHRSPAHSLIRAFRKKGKTKAKQRKTSDDEFEQSSDGEERLAALGGWVRW